MEDLYRHAARVLVWLREATPDGSSNITMKFLAQLGDADTIDYEDETFHTGDEIDSLPDNWLECLASMDAPHPFPKRGPLLCSSC